MFNRCFIIKNFFSHLSNMEESQTRYSTAPVFFFSWLNKRNVDIVFRSLIGNRGKKFSWHTGAVLCGAEGRGGRAPTKGRLSREGLRARQGRLLLGPGHRLETPGSVPLHLPTTIIRARAFGVAHVIVAVFGDHG